MKYRTHGNMCKATLLIMEKEYDKETANDIAINIFNTAEQNKNGMSIEWYIDKIATITNGGNNK